MHRQSCVNVIDFPQPHTEESQSPASLKDKAVSPCAAGRRLARQCLKLKSLKKSKRVLEKCSHHFSLLLLYMDPEHRVRKEQGKNWQPSTSPTFQNFFHSSPKLESQKQQFFFCGGERKHLKEGSNKKPLSAFFPQFRLNSDWSLSSQNPSILPPILFVPGSRLQHMEYMSPSHTLLQACMMAIKDTQGRVTTEGAQSS